RSAVERFPSSMILLISCVTSVLRCTGSATTLRCGAGPLRGIGALALLLRAVLRARLLAVPHAGGVERRADDLVADTRQVLHAAAAREHGRVLLQVVALARDVRGDLDPGGQAHTADLAQGRVRLLRRGGVHARADAAALRGALQRRRLGLFGLGPP